MTTSDSVIMGLGISMQNDVDEDIGEQNDQDNVVEFSAQGVPGRRADTALDISEDNLALRLVAKYGETMRYVGQWNRWLVYDGKVWSVDHTMLVYERARAVIRDVAKRLFTGEMNRAMDGIAKNPNLTEHEKKSKIREAKKRAIGTTRSLKTQKTVYNIVSLARHDERVAATVDVWDSDPWLLNTPEGTVNLRSGEVYPHRASDYFQCITNCGPSAKPSTRWLEFINEITEGDTELASYMQRVLGYCLTGTTGEQAMFFGHGVGANGKSVLINVVAHILADYHKSAGIETFIQGDQRHPTELADLRGARLVTSSETQAGRKWDEVKVKRLTGGDVIKARFMRQDFFEFYPQFKLFLVGNNKPGINNVDEAMRRRFNLIPFAARIPKHKQDPELVNKLKEESGGILAWILEGCMEWQRIGLAPPDNVKEATNAYLAMEDKFGTWWEEDTQHDANGFETVGDLFVKWQKWCAVNEEIAGSKKTFSQNLLNKADVLKIRYARTNRGRGFYGVKIIGGEHD